MSSTNEIVDQIMSEIEKDKLIAFRDDAVMFNAVKKFILFTSYSDGVAEKGKPFHADRNWALQLAFQAINPAGMPRSNEELGADLRAWVKGVNMVEGGFQELLQISKSVEPEKEAPNKGL